MIGCSITQNLLRTWLYGIDGWVHWLTVSPGNDPWFHFYNSLGDIVAVIEAVSQDPDSTPQPVRVRQQSPKHLEFLRVYGSLW